MNIQRALILIILALLTACGGGGGGSTQTAAQTSVTGVASKGLITNGVVTVFALNTNGSQGTQLGTGSTDGSGAYNISIGNYSGPVLIEVSGNYLDEASGSIKTVPVALPLRAALPSASGAVSASVTPLTDLAVRQAGALTSQNISAANTLLSNIFKFDIINTMPAAPTTAAFQASTTTQAQKDYALILAALSQQMSTNSSDLATTLTAVNSGITSTGITVQTAAAIAAAGNTFVTTNPNNQTPITTVTGSALQTIGAATMNLTVSLQGSAAATVKGFQATITLPAGVSIRADASGEVLAGVITAANGYTGAKYTAATNTTPATLTLDLMSATTLTAGEVMAVTLSLATGSTAPLSGDFLIAASKIVASGGTAVSGASLSLQL